MACPHFVVANLSNLKAPIFPFVLIQSILATKNCVHVAASEVAHLAGGLATKTSSGGINAWASISTSPPNKDNFCSDVILKWSHPQAKSAQLKAVLSEKLFYVQAQCNQRRNTKVFFKKSLE